MPDQAKNIHTWFQSFFQPWRKKYKHAIEAGTLPPTRGGYFTKLIYDHRFGLPLFFVLLLTGLAYYTFAEIDVVKSHLNDVLPDTKTKGTFLLAVMSLPGIVYAWFVRAYERGISIVKEEAELWSKELNGLINQAVDSNNQMALRLVAIRQMQDYLSGAKWKANQAANSSAIFQAFSSINDELTQNAVDEIRSQNGPDGTVKSTGEPPKIESPLLDVIGSVIRSALAKTDGQRVLKVIGNNLSELNLSNLDIRNIDLSGCRLTHSKLSHSILSGAECSRVDLFQANLTGANLSGANLTGADLFWADLSGADLSVADLSGANLSGACLHQTKLFKAYLLATDLTRANLTGAYLSGANLSGANLSGADLSGADLSGAYLSGANLTGANPTGANLSGANLTGAYLRQTKLFKADLSGADFTDADLTDANFTGVIFSNTRGFS